MPNPGHRMSPNNGSNNLWQWKTQLLCVWAPLAGSCLPAEITYNTQRALFHVCCGVFLVVLPILLLKLVPGDAHPTSPQAGDAAWWGQTSWKEPRKERKEQWWQNKGGMEAQSFRLCSLWWVQLCCDTSDSSDGDKSVFHWAFLLSPVASQSLCDQGCASRTPGFRPCLTQAFGLARGMMLHFSLEEDIASHQCYFIFKQRAVITAAGFVHFITIK